MIRDEVQKSVSDWDTFNATAEKMKACSYKMTSTANGYIPCIL